MKSSKTLYVILNNDETLYKNDRQEPMIYRDLKNFINQNRFKNCKVAIFGLNEIRTINQIETFDNYKNKHK